MAKLTSIFNKEEIQRSDVHPKRITKWIHYTKLKQNENQYCNGNQDEIEALADLIEADGEVLQDLLVRKIDTDEYEIIGGHKRRLACKSLVENRGKEEFAFLPCIVQNISDVRAEFRIYSTNGHHEKTSYEKMYELERMEYLIKNYPEEFPHLQTGRMVERLAKQLNMKRATVGEYQSISKNLVDEAMEKFKVGDIDKSAAVTLSRIPEGGQREIVEKGITKNCEIKKYIETNLEPDATDIKRIFFEFHINEYDQSHENRKDLVNFLKDNYGKKGYQKIDNAFQIICSQTHIEIAGKKVTWERCVKLIDKWCPYQRKNSLDQSDKREIPCSDELSQKPYNDSKTKEIQKSSAISKNPINKKKENNVLCINRKHYMETLSEEEMAQYLNKFLNVTILESVENITEWLEEVVNIPK